MRHKATFQKIWRTLISCVIPSVSQQLAVKGEGNLIIQISGNGNTVVSGQPWLELTQFQKLAKMLAKGEVSASDASLLRYYSARTIPLVGREEFLDKLLQWLSDPSPISVLGIVGPSGCGKKRVALELCKLATNEGWSAGFLLPQHLTRFRKQADVSRWGWNRSTLIVLDQAASHLDDLQEWFVDLAAIDHTSADFDGSQPKLRILLLERDGDISCGWWESFTGKGGVAGDSALRLLETSGPWVLPKLNNISDRKKIFKETLDLVGADGSIINDPRVEEIIQNKSLSPEPLHLMIFALSAARHGLSHIQKMSQSDVVFSVARDELSRIADFGKIYGIPEEFCHHLAAFVYLCGGLTENQAFQVIEAEKIATGHDNAGDRATVLSALNKALPFPNGGIAPIGPDAIGEAILLVVWGGHNPIKQNEIIRRASQINVESVLSTLVRMCQSSLIRSQEEPLRWLNFLASEWQDDISALKTLSRTFPLKTMALSDLANKVSSRIVCLIKKEMEKIDDILLEEDDLLELARSAYRLKENGDLNEALSSSEYVINIITSSDEYYKKFIHILPWISQTYFNCLFLMGRFEEALGQADELVSFYKRMDHEVLMASAFEMRGSAFAELGDWESARGDYVLSVELYRKFASLSGDLFLSNLAGMLMNLSAALENLNKYEEALEYNKEAVSILRKFTAKNPDAYWPYLAMALANVSLKFDKLGRLEEALSASCEALEIRRQLVERYSHIFLPQYAFSLNNTAGRLRKLRRFDDAESYSKEAVKIYRNLVYSQRDRFLRDLTLSLYTYALILYESAKWVDALSYIEEALTNRRYLCSLRPRVYSEHLGGDLCLKVLILEKIGDWKTTKETCEELFRLISGMQLCPAWLAKEIIGSLAIYERGCKKYNTPVDANLFSGVKLKIQSWLMRM